MHDGHAVVRSVVVAVAAAVRVVRFDASLVLRHAAPLNVAPVDHDVVTSVLPLLGGSRTTNTNVVIYIFSCATTLYFTPFYLFIHQFFCESQKLQ